MIMLNKGEIEVETAHVANKTPIGLFCSVCGSEITFENFSVSNRQFVVAKLQEGKLDEIITVARIVNEQLPELCIASENKALATVLADIVGNKMETSINTLTTLSNMLSQLLQKVPEGIKAELAIILSKLETLNETTSKSSESFVQTFNELINKPTSKGRVGERTLSQAWGMTYTHDSIREEGGPGKADFIVTPMVKDKYMANLSVERKAGTQKYNFRHVKEAINHARDEGSKYALIVYDSFEDNLPEAFGPLFIDRVDGISVAVTDINNNGWKMARYVFSVLELTNISNEMLEQIDVTGIGETVKELCKITEQIGYLRKKSNSAIQACEGVRDGINILEQIFEKQVQKLRSNLGEIA
jgi:hypothetical protein